MTRPIALLAVFGLLLVGVVAGAAPAAAASGAAAAPADGATSVSTDVGAAATSGAAVQAQDEEHDDVVHEHPDSADGATDVDLAEWLAGNFLSTVEESADAIEDGDYEDGQAAFDGAYEQRLEQYAQIAPHTERPTDNASDPRTRDEVALGEFQAVRESQTALAAQLVEYESAVADYEAARDAGDEERALELAREAVARSETVRENASVLRERYSRIESVLDTDLSSADAAIRETASRTRSEADGVAADAFSETTLVVDAGDYAVSADRTIQIEGQLLDDEGEPIEGATIAVSDPVEPAAGDVGGDLGGSATVGSGATSTTQTDADGEFELAHRAVFVPTNTENLVVEYRPERLAPHRASRTSIGVSVEQVEGELSVSDVPDAVQYGDDVGVEVTTTASDDDVAGVPVRLIVGGESVAGVTDEDGSLDLPASLPRDVPSGEQSVRVEVPVEGWSVAFDSQSQPIDVSRADVTLSADSEPAHESGVLVSGRLETADGTPVAGAPVTIAADGDGQIRRASSNGSGMAGPLTVRTDDEGRYETTLDGTSSAEAVNVSYAESDSNLNAAATSTALAEPSSGGLLGQLTGLATHPFVLLGFALAVVFAAGVVDWQQWRPDDAEDDRPPEPDAEPDADDDAEDGRQDPLAVAAGQVPEDPSTATVLAYGVGRSALDDVVEVSPDATHSEFYQACKADGLDPETMAAVDTLTRQYEEAAFAPGEVDERTARTAISAARTLR